ncbi:MAG: type I restriction endonuclease subunit R [Candidatus Limnocylindrales bacterium]
MSTAFLEADLEDVVLGYLASLGYAVAHGPEIAPGGPGAERTSFSEAFLVDRMRKSLARINPELDLVVIDQVIAAVRRPESQNLVRENARIHALMREGVAVEVRLGDGSLRTRRARLVAFGDPGANDWLAANQFVVTDEQHTRRADVVVFLNGMPVVVYELKSSSDEKATIKGAFYQIGTYKSEVPGLFLANAFCVISDGIVAKLGSVTAGYEHYVPWRAIDTPTTADGALPQVEVLTRGTLEKRRFLDILEHFIDWSDLRSGLVKRVARYNQFWAVNAAVDAIVAASAPEGDQRAGIVWHTQGAGKSFEMLLTANKLMRHPAMANPTVVLVTDRNDLDDQLFTEEFAPSRVLPEPPRRAESRTNLKEMLSVASGGIVFTTIQKFGRDDSGGDPVLTARRNVVVFVDEAHRSQYGLLEGLAGNMHRAMPNATFIGFTGTPIELADRSTRQVFGDYISTYTPQQAIEDGATVPVYYESRLIKIGLSAEDEAALDEAWGALTGDLSEEDQQRLGSRWTRMESILGSEERLAKLTADFLEHWEARRSQLFGKAMLVLSSRRIAAAVYDRIVELRPDWHSDDDAKGKIKVVYTGSAADRPEIRRHVRTKEQLEDVKRRASNPRDELEVLVVCDLWLTGFNSPPLHTMYVDKPLKDHGLFQAITRVNRPYLDKPGGLIVDYIGITDQITRSVARYASGTQPAVAIDIGKAVAFVVETHEIVSNILHGHAWTVDPALAKADRLAAITAGVDFVLGDEDRRTRFLEQTYRLVRGFSLCAKEPAVRALTDDIAFFSAVRTGILKLEAEDDTEAAERREGLETAIGQLVSSAIVAGEVIDVFAAAGMEKPEVSVLSEEFLAKIATDQRRNLAFELLRRLLNDQIRSLGRTNVVQHRLFSDRLTAAIRAYQNHALSVAEVINELVDLAHAMKAEHQRQVASGLSPEELAFYDAVCQNDSAVLELGDEVLRQIVEELVGLMRRETTVDWRYREPVRAAMRVKIKHLLRKHGYPPDKEKKAVDLVIEQAELFADEMTAA